MKKYKIIIDKEVCIGCAACTAISNNFVMKNDKAIVKKAGITEKEFKENKEAMDICPVNAIKIVEEK